MKTVGKIAIVIASMILGLIVQVFIATDAAVAKTLEGMLKFIPGISVPVLDFENPFIPGLIFLVCSLIVVSIITYLVRVFADTKNLEKLSGIVNAFVTILIGLPIASLLLYVIDTYGISTLEEQLALGPVIRIAANCLVFAILFVLLTLFFSKQYYEKLKQPRKRCRLEVCEATSKTEFKIEKVVLDSYLFEQCTSAMRNYGQLKPKQFFRITEMNWNKTQEVDHWNYYKNGEVNHDSEEQFLEKLMLIEETNKVYWQG